MRFYVSNKVLASLSFHGQIGVLLLVSFCFWRSLLDGRKAEIGLLDFFTSLLSLTTCRSFLYTSRFLSLSLSSLDDWVFIFTSDFFRIFSKLAFFPIFGFFDSLFFFFGSSFIYFHFVVAHFCRHARGAFWRLVAWYAS